MTNNQWTIIMLVLLFLTFIVVISVFLNRNHRKRFPSETSQDTLTAQDIAWFSSPTENEHWKHLGSPCQFCGLRVETLFEAGSKNMVIGKAAHLAAIERKNNTSGDQQNTIVTWSDGTTSSIEGRVGIGKDILPPIATGSRNVIIGTKNIPQPWCNYLAPIKYTGIHQYCGEKLHPDSKLYCPKHFRANKHH